MKYSNSTAQMYRENGPSERFEKARKSVERIKRFYKHLMIYLVINGIVLLVKSAALRFFIDQGGEGLDDGFMDWFQLNIILTPLLWGIGVLIHGLLVFKYPDFTLKSFVSKRMKHWEERQIQKYLEQEDKE